MERLESRVCPSELTFGAILVKPNDPLTHAGDKLIDIESGKAIVFVTNINQNVLADIGDIVGISVSKGVRLTSFVDIHGDIVTNLTKKGVLSGESRDGSVLVAKANIAALNIVAGQVGSSGNVLGDGIVEGQILATAGIGRAKLKLTNSVTEPSFPINIDGGVQIIATGTAADDREIFADVNATIGGAHIKKVTLATLEAVKDGSSVGGVRIGGAEGSMAATELTLIQAGDGAPGRRGGSVFDIEISGAVEPFSVIAGDGGTAPKKAGNGGFLENLNFLTSVDGAILLRAGSGGDTLKKAGGEGGSVKNLVLFGSGDYSVLGGAGGEGGEKSNGGNGGSLAHLLVEDGTSYNLVAGEGGDGGRDGGNGGFITDVDNSTNVTVAAPPTFILSADLNEDGSIDLLTLNALSNSMTVFLNDGDGNFEAGGTFTVGDNPQRATVTDVDGDGRLDVFVTNFDSNDISLLIGNGDGTFDPAVNFDVGQGPVGISVGQANFFNDNLLDIFVANSLDNTITVLFGTGGGQFDPDVSGILDAGVPVFALATRELDPFFSFSLDIAVTSPAGDEVLVLLGNGIFFGGDGTFQPPQDFTVGNTPVDIQIADMNLDFIPDLITANENSDNVSILFGNFDEDFPLIDFDPVLNLAVGAGPSAVAVVQLNGDGRPDLVVANTDDNTISVLLSTGFGTFGPATSFAVGATPVSVATGDFDGDGNQDVAVANVGSSNLSLLFGKGDGTFVLAGEETGGVTFRAGDGGDGATGDGGEGGFIGQDPHRDQPLIQDPNINIAALGAGGAITIQAGSGGEGAENGGKGAGLAGIQATTSGAVVLQTGTGGDGARGTGGDGGSIGRGSPQFDVVVNSGAESSIIVSDGGDGTTGGGQGGKIGNSQFNASAELSVTTGAGGSATVAGQGGSGGDVTDSEFIALPELTIITGQGGDSVGKTGGSGGSLINSHLEVTGTSDMFTLTMGDGGAGTASGGIGGVGGHFKNSDVVMNVAIGGELAARIHTGSGGAGTVDGGNAGDLSGIHVLGVPDILFDPDFDVLAVDLYIDLGAGGDGGMAGGNGGSLTSLKATGVTGDLEINNAVGGTNGRGGAGLTGGSGGSVRDVTGIDDLGLVGGTLTVVSGDGGSVQSGTGGAAGQISDIRGNFQGIVEHHDGTLTTGVRLQAGQGGSSPSGVGGVGGSILGSNVTSGTTDISFRAGDGGDGSTLGGVGGDLSGMKANSAQALLFQAGSGGIATGLDGIGGNGGDVSNLDQQGNPGQLIRQIVAGNGGAAPELGGVGGAGGSITNVHTLGDIGDFEMVYGFNSMGGLFAGAGGLGSASHGLNGNVTDVTAGRIAAIVAGIGAGPVAVGLIDDITANVLGANVDSDDPGEFIFPAFDFHDANGDGEFTLGADPDHDPAEAPIDGLIFADVIGSINLPEGVLALFTVEVSNLPPIGNVDPQL